jgi:hypothetical protein
MIRTGDPIDARLAKYLQHVVREEQWPPGTTFDEFLDSLIDTVEGDGSGLFADRREHGWVLTFAGRSENLEGLDGGPWIVVMSDCQQDRLLTAFQPSRGLDTSRTMSG